MEYKCNFCGKTYTDPIKYATCVAQCSEAEKARIKEEEKKKQAVQQAERCKEIDKQYSEYIRLRKEADQALAKLQDMVKKEYSANPSFCETGNLYKILWPEHNPFDFINLFI